VVRGTDDGREYETGAVRLGQKNLYVGRDILLAFRFEGISVPRGAIITSAVLEFTALSHVGRPITVRYLGEATGDSSPLVQQVGNLSSRAKTQAFVDETPGRWVLGQNQSQELRAIVQEIVDRADWAPGHALTLFVADHGSVGSRVVAGYEDQATAQAVVLRLGYTVP
jgi:type IV pilus assembly protein PilY1